MSIAAAMGKERLELYVDIRGQARRGRIFKYYLRNGRGATAVAAYSTQASASTPLSWEELSDDLRSDHFTVINLRHRLAYLKRDPWRGFFEMRQRLPG